MTHESQDQSAEAYSHEIKERLARYSDLFPSIDVLDHKGQLSQIPGIKLPFLFVTASNLPKFQILEPDGLFTHMTAARRDHFSEAFGYIPGLDRVEVDAEQYQKNKDKIEREMEILEGLKMVRAHNLATDF